MGKHVVRIGVLSLLCFVTGCQYYKVTDPVSGRQYVTNNWAAGRYGYSGTARFTDLKTGRDVTLPASEVERISEDDAKAEIAAAKTVRH